MRRIILLLPLLCLPAYAAVPPLPTVPTVKRIAPLQSPKAASEPKSKAMVKGTRFTVAATGDPVIPMMVEVAPASDGRIILIADAYKPAGKTMTFEYATFPTGPWEFLFHWTEYPEDLWEGLAWNTQGDTKFIRATHGVPSAFSPASAPRVPPSGVVKLPPSKTKPKRLQ